jgi:hypothetical protein
MANPQELTNQLLTQILAKVNEIDAKMTTQDMSGVIEAINAQTPIIVGLQTSLAQANVKLSCLHDVHCVEQHAQNYCYRCKDSFCKS